MRTQCQKNWKFAVKQFPGAISNFTICDLSKKFPVESVQKAKAPLHVQKTNICKHMSKKSWKLAVKQMFGCWM